MWRNLGRRGEKPGTNLSLAVLRVNQPCQHLHLPFPVVVPLFHTSVSLLMLFLGLAGLGLLSHLYIFS
jgi:hypothetical protein